MSFAIGINGATGVTGEVTLRILEERSFPVGELRLFASRRSVGQRIRWKGRDYPVEAMEDGRFDGLDVVISATSAGIAREWAPRIVASGAVVIDQSSAFRLDPAVPLVIPEINRSDIANHGGIIAGPNCTTAVAVMAVAPLARAVGIRSIISSSYQSTSGGGRDAIAEFLDLSREAVEQPEALRGHEALKLPAPQFFPHEPWAGAYPTPLRAAGIDDILVGRVRTVPALDNGLSLFASGDNLRKGNALNAVQVAECVLGIAE
jgi:aspartate-semialdehyde dehydrogenase